MDSCKKVYEVYAVEVHAVKVSGVVCLKTCIIFFIFYNDMCCIISEVPSGSFSELKNVNETSEKSNWRHYMEKYTLCRFRIITLIMCVSF